MEDSRGWGASPERGINKPSLALQALSLLSVAGGGRFSCSHLFWLILLFLSPKGPRHICHNLCDTSAYFVSSLSYACKNLKTSQMPQYHSLQILLSLISISSISLNGTMKSYASHKGRVLEDEKDMPWKHRDLKRIWNKISRNLPPSTRKSYMVEEKKNTTFYFMSHSSFTPHSSILVSLCCRYFFTWLVLH